MKDKVKSLLDHFENQTLTGTRATAYNYLIDYDEGLVFETLEGERLIGLCIEILEEEK